MAGTKISTGKIVGFVFLGLFVLFLFSSACFTGGLFAGGFSLALKGSPISAMPDSIYMIRMEGVISGTETSSLFSGTAVTPEYMIEQFIAAEKNPNIKALLIRVNSGGGSAAASQEIFEELKKVKKPVVISVTQVSEKL